MEEDFHRSRRMFVLGPDGLIVAPCDDKRSHAQWFADTGMDKEHDLDSCPRGFWDVTGLYIYKGADFSPVFEREIWKVCLAVEESVPSDSPVFSGMVPGVVGERWEPMVRCGTIGRILICYREGMDIREPVACDYCGGKPPHCCPDRREAATVRAAVEEALPMPADIPIERVTLQEEVKLFRCKTTLAFLDSRVYSLRSAEVDIPNPVPVHDQNNRRIGFALVEHVQNGTALTAEITFDYATEERLLVQNGEKLWAYAFGSMRIDPRDMQVFDFQRPLRVERLSVDGIQLLRMQPQDKRLDPIRES